MQVWKVYEELNQKVMNKWFHPLKPACLNSPCSLCKERYECNICKFPVAMQNFMLCYAGLMHYHYHYNLIRNDEWKLNNYNNWPIWAEDMAIIDNANISCNIPQVQWRDTGMSRLWVFLVTRHDKKPFAAWLTLESVKFTLKMKPSKLLLNFLQASPTLSFVVHCTVILQQPPATLYWI